MHKTGLRNSVRSQHMLVLPLIPFCSLPLKSLWLAGMRMSQLRLCATAALYLDYLSHILIMKHSIHPLQVSDRGGGIKRSQIDHYYKFFSSSCKLGSRGLRWVSFLCATSCTSPPFSMILPLHLLF